MQIYKPAVLISQEEGDDSYGVDYSGEQKESESNPGDQLQLEIGLAKCL